MSHFKTGILVLVLALITAPVHNALAQRPSDKQASPQTDSKNTLSAQARLRKMSLSMKGMLPTEVEYKALEDQKSPKQVESFLAEKAKEYSKAREFNAKIAFRMADDFTMFQDSGAATIRRNIYDSNPSVEDQPPDDFLNGYNMTEFIKAGYSWNNLLKKDYVQAYNSFYQANRGIRFLLEPRNIENVKLVLSIFRAQNVDLENVKVYMRGTDIVITYFTAKATEYLNLLKETLDKYKVSYSSSLSPRNFAYFRYYNGRKDDRDEPLFRLLFQATVRVGDKEGTIYNLDRAIYDKLYFMRESLESEKTKAYAVIETNDAVGAYTLAAKYIEGKANARQMLQEQIEKASSPVMGLISTSQFQDRFRKTIYSKAAATYRIYLCDNMTQVAIGGSTVTTDALSAIKFTGVTSQRNQMQSNANANAARQHVQPSCMGCHQKLDPAKEITDGNKTFPITFVYFDDDGVKQTFVAESQADFYTKLMTQEQFYNCQVRKFWNWFIGEDVVLTEQYKSELKSVYKETDGSVPALVQKIVSLKAFNQAPNLSEPTIENVAYILKRCDQCHNGNSDATVPPLNKMPFTLSIAEKDPAKLKADHVDWLKSILKETKFHKMGQSAKMPPKDADWTLGESEFADIARWINAGARDAAGKPTITTQDAQSLLNGADPKIMTALSVTESKPSYLPKWKRYFENYDLMFTLRQLFGANVLNTAGQNMTPARTSSNGIACSMEAIRTAAMESVRNADTREYRNFAPTQYYQTVLDSCARHLTYIMFSNLNNPEAQILRSLKMSSPTMNLQELQSMPWKSISANEQSAIIKAILDATIGPKVMTEDKQNKLTSAIQTAISNFELKKQNTNVGTAISQVIYYILIRDEFLSY